VALGPPHQEAVELRAQVGDSGIRKFGQGNGIGIGVGRDDGVTLTRSFR
jgi:hypothetical protein